MKNTRALSHSVLVAIVLSLAGVVPQVWGEEGTCDDDCPFDSAGYFLYCDDSDIGPIECGYDDGHYYASFGGSC